MDEEGAERVRPFLKKHPMEYTVALGNEALAKEFKTDDGIPITVVFDRTGKQVKRFQGYLSESELLTAVQSSL
jgi:thioredoxin-related protein